MTADNRGGMTRHVRIGTRRLFRMSPTALGLGLALWVVVHAIARGRALQVSVPQVNLGAAPLVGRDRTDGWDWRFGISLVAAGLIALGVVAANALEWFWRLRLRAVVAIAAISAMAFAVALALVDGADGILHGATDHTEYLPNVAASPPAGRFVRDFLADIDGYSVHVRGHPPGFLLLLKALAAIGLGGRWPTALLSVLAIAATVAAVLVAVWAVAGHEWVRRVAPFLIVVPYALWMVTSADSFFTAVGAVGLAAIVVATRSAVLPGVLLGLFGGLLLGLLLFLTYLGAVFALVIVPVAIAAIIRRHWHSVAVIGAAVVGALAVLVAFRLAGFWWFDGARRTRTEYWDGTAQFRTWAYFRWGNIAVALIAIGPASVVGLTRLRDRRMWMLVGGAVLAVAASHFSQYTRGEVERIWLLFYPWLAVAGGALASRRAMRSASTWLAIQACCAIGLQAALVSKW